MSVRHCELVDRPDFEGCRMIGGLRGRVEVYLGVSYALKLREWPPLRCHKCQHCEHDRDHNESMCRA